MSFFGRSSSSSNLTPGPYAGPAKSDRSFAYRELEQTPRSSNPSGGNSLRVMYTRDWRTALRTPPTYRIGNRTVRFNYHFGLVLLCIVALFVVFYYVKADSKSSSDIAWANSVAGQDSKAGLITTKSSNSINKFSSIISIEQPQPQHNQQQLRQNGDSSTYNGTYPLTQPLVGKGGLITYRIGMVADLDKDSKFVKPDGSIVWRSFFKKGYLTFATLKKEIKISWDKNGDAVPLESSFSLKDRGMELSELVTFNGKLLTFDDRTGLIYEITQNEVIPWVILMDGDGHSTKGFKSEWATVKQQTLYVGSMGKEWTSSFGDYVNDNPMFVKTVRSDGQVQSLNWSYNFKLLRQEAMQIQFPGYMIHESGLWSEVHKKWFFLPRRCSTLKYNEKEDEHMGCNLLITATEQFEKIETIELDRKSTSPSHGFSSFKFIPGSDDSIIVAIKSEELDGKTSTFITAFNIEGKTILPEEQISTDYKYEGFEFI